MFLITNYFSENQYNVDNSKLSTEISDCLIKIVISAVLRQLVQYSLLLLLFIYKKLIVEIWANECITSVVIVNI